MVLPPDKKHFPSPASGIFKSQSICWTSLWLYPAGPYIRAAVDTGFPRAFWLTPELRSFVWFHWKVWQSCEEQSFAAEPQVCWDAWHSPDDIRLNFKVLIWLPHPGSFVWILLCLKISFAKGYLRHFCEVPQSWLSTLRCNYLSPPEILCSTLSFVPQDLIRSGARINCMSQSARGSLVVGSNRSLMVLNSGFI